MTATKPRGRLGAALQQALAGKLEPSRAGEARAPGAGLFAHGSRARLFQAVLDHPLAQAAGLARATGLTQGAVRWHLAALLQAGVLRAEGAPSRARYMAAGDVEEETRTALLALQAPHVLDMLRVVARSPGLSLSQLAGEVGASPQAVLRAARAVDGLAFLEAQRDGRYTRFYPADGVSTFLARRAAQLPRACQRLETALRAAGETVVVTRRSREEIVFQVGRRGARREFRLRAMLTVSGRS